MNASEKPSWSGPLSAAVLRRSLGTRVLGRGDLEVWEQIGSTQERALELARAGAPEGTLVLAEAQSAGRGRLGRAWYSPPGRNLYFSVVLRPRLRPEEAALLTLAAGLAGVEAVRRVTGREGRVKWPNDVLLAGRKVGGILTEMEVRGGEVLFVVLGVGFNVNLTAADLPPELAEQAGSLFLATGRLWDRSEVLAALLGELEANYEALVRGEFEELRRRYEQVCQNVGARVRVQAAEGIIPGRAVGVDASGELLVRQDKDGRVIRVRAGEVSLE